ncbi:MAG: prevent-host-death protein [Candidatus Eisenbacteria bacterium]|jgi:antitoxin (DNA-binding transcriptional repressor) of toxin-antitoxin stability system|nr:prevent-host-death protein [Candidatus Eisenbacteria bacterium]
MRRVSVREMRSVVGRLGEILKVDGELIVTTRGTPIARVTPVTRRTPLPSHRDLRSSMERLNRGSEEVIRADRDGQ